LTQVQHGCLALADISGYTRYLGGVELEHSQDILADLLGTVASELEAVGEIAKLEGDAVFVVGRGADADGEMLLAALDASYFAFARRRRTIELRSSCTCQACTRIPSLDLKLIVHHGEYVEHFVAGRPEVVGNDVIVAHRLLKNDVSNSTGAKAFALITEPCRNVLSLEPRTLNLRPHVERYEDVGEIRGWVRDLGARWIAATEREQCRVAPEEADISFSQSYDASAPAVWDAVVAPEKILQWKVGATDVRIDNPSGARDVGTITHCIHGRRTFDEEILDWRPFSYFTYREVGPIGPMLWTLELTENGDRTTLELRIKRLGGRGQAALMRLGRRKLSRIITTNLDNLGAALRPEQKVDS
jgi:class 3 adenylate cyclase/uncharacterized protein YndB with AHSA1/START domain